MSEFRVIPKDPAYLEQARSIQKVVNAVMGFVNDDVDVTRIRSEILFEIAAYGQENPAHHQALKDAIYAAFEKYREVTSEQPAN